MQAYVLTGLAVYFSQLFVSRLGYRKTDFQKWFDND